MKAYLLEVQHVKSWVGNCYQISLSQSFLTNMYTVLKCMQNCNQLFGLKNISLVTYPTPVPYAVTRTHLKAAFSLALLGDQIRNEEAINSTQNRIKSLKVFTSYFIAGWEFFRIFTFYMVFDDLFLNWFSMHVSNNRKYVCGRRLYACINRQKFKCLDLREITSLRKVKKHYLHGNVI